MSRDSHVIEEIPEILESVAMVEDLGIRVDVAQEIWNTFYTEKREDEADLLFHVRNFLLAAFETENHVNGCDMTEILDHMGFTPLESADKWSLVSHVLADRNFVFNTVSKQNICDWAIIIMEQRFDSMKFYDARTLRHGIPIMPSPPFFPLSLVPDIDPRERVIGNDRRPPPDGFILENDRATPCWHEPPDLESSPPSSPNYVEDRESYFPSASSPDYVEDREYFLPRASSPDYVKVTVYVDRLPPQPSHERPQPVVEQQLPLQFAARGEPDGYFEENGQYVAYWNQLPDDY